MIHKTILSKIRFSICAILTMVTVNGWGQDCSRRWNLGALTWQDFQKVDSSKNGEHSYLEFYLDVSDCPFEDDGVNTWRPTATALMNQQLSWVDTHYMSRNELRYNQVLFNIVELQRRYMQIEIDTSGETDVDRHMDELISVTDSFCILTNYGADIEAVWLWDCYIREQMSKSAALIVENEAKSKQSMQTEVTTLRCGFNIGGSAQLLGNYLQRYFSNGGGLHMEFEFGQKRHLFSLGLYCGSSTCKENLIHKKDSNQDLFKKDPLSSLDFNLQYGYILLDLNRFRLTPFAAIGTQGFYYTPEMENSSSLGFTTFNWRVGLDLRYHIWNDRYMDGNDFQQYYLSIYSRFYYSQATLWNAIDTPAGSIFNITVGLSFAFRNGYYSKSVMSDE